jgi:hypothetical protein
MDSLSAATGYFMSAIMLPMISSYKADKFDVNSHTYHVGIIGLDVADVGNLIRRYRSFVVANETDTLHYSGSGSQQRAAARKDRANASP